MIEIVLILITGLGVLLGLEPFANSIFSLLTPIGLILLSRKTKKYNIFYSILIYIALSFSITLFAFPWVFKGVRNISNANLLTASLFFITYSVIANLKVLFLFFFSNLILKFSKVSVIWVYAIVAMATDIWTYQLFPWFYGNLSVGNTLEIQIASFFSVYVLSFLLFLKGYLVLVVGKFFFHYKKQKGFKATFNYIPKILKKVLINFKHRVHVHTSVAFMILVLVYLFGFYKLYWNTQNTSGTVTIAIIQPNTGRAVANKKEDFEYARAALTTVFELSLKAIYESHGKLDMLVLPESAIPFHGIDNSQENIDHSIYSVTFHSILGFLSKYGRQTIIYNEMDRKSGKLFNLASVFGLDGKRADTYQKQLLLPIGEFLPFEKQFPILRKIFPETGYYKQSETSKLLEYSYIPRENKAILQPFKQEDLSQINNLDALFANWPKVDRLKKGYFLPLICYEAMHPDLVRNFLQLPEKPDFIVNLANDSWFGNYLENYQHSGAVKFRAIETGRYVVRSTLSGFSSFISPKGEYLQTSKGLESKEVLLQEIPKSSEVTPYALYGKIPLYCLMVILFVFIISELRIKLPRQSDNNGNDYGKYK
ncbi:MAG: apolipoprotein N-acyltransferase [Leptospiraceae bacterium]|nr:apolipoprotein N-acyltransferase [Leptospiraceae bacterium]